MGRAHLFSRGERSVLVADSDGYMAHKLDKDGRLVFTLGRRAKPSDTGPEYKPMHEIPDCRTIKRGAGPFFAPTNLAMAPENGALYIPGGDDNSRIHRFTSGGAYVQSWGEPGIRPEQFHIPHGVFAGEGR